MLFAALLNAQSLKDSLFGGKLKIDTGKIVTNPGIKISNESISNAEAYSSNNYYLQKPWKRFVEHYTFLISTDVIGSRKVKYGVYDILIDARLEWIVLLWLKKLPAIPKIALYSRFFFRRYEKCSQISSGNERWPAIVDKIQTAY